VTYPRTMSVSLEATPNYHVTARCVRRAWLWGVDEYAGKDYSHRKNWVLDRLAQLCAVFAIDCLAYAVMSNHYHLILGVDALRARGWSDAEIVERWSRLFRLPILIERWRKGSAGDAENAAAQEIIALWRSRLHDLSWFMRSLNEHLARLANAEDGCTGRFWEGRFKSQALLDEVGLLTAMAYVDLNPIRAGIAPLPEDSDFTSIQARIRDLKEQEAEDDAEAMPATEANTPVPLLAFRDQASASQPAIPFPLLEYLELVDWSSRIVRHDKRSAIDLKVPPILQRLHIDREAWQTLLRPGANRFGRAIGTLDRLTQYAKAAGQQYLRGQRQAQLLYGSG
jgi:hypothetical protein